MQKFPIDKEWFHQKLGERGYSVRRFAAAMEMDAAALSRMLSGQRNMSAEEQDKIARLLRLSLTDIAEHRGQGRKGFEEVGQAGYEAEMPKPSRSAAKSSVGKGRSGRHPIFGCMQGTMNIPNDLDLTAPADPDWAKVYDDE